MSGTGDAVSTVKSMIKQQVAGGGSLPGIMRNLSALSVPEHVLAEARQQYEQEVGLIIELVDPQVLVEKEVREGFWYAGPNDDDVFWPALLAELKPRLPESALDGVDNSSNKIVNLMRPPGAPQIRTRGLVLGHVQSGKTTSFMSVAAKAADVGYRMIIVLSGVTDNLRSQTQARLEEQLVGTIGDKWFLLTDLETDFQRTGNAAVLMNNSQHRMLAVVKKNPYRLRRLEEWLRSAGQAALLSCPILIIDDEADQASIDVGKTRMSKINNLIRKILECPKAGYVAYTATPFANLLIDPAVSEGLYPRDFIVDLPAGDGYYGPERLFGRDLLDHIDDDEVAAPDDVIREVVAVEIPQVQPPKGRGAVDNWDPEIAPSLATAIDWFVLATAARWARGAGDAHSSMLVHTSMLAEAHFRLQDAVQDYCDDLQAEVYSSDPTTMKRLRDLWEAEYGRVVRKVDEPDVSWEDVLARTGPVLDDLKVIADNYKSKERLVYEAGVSSTCIAIGGNTLSRGLTLEGLVSSYFVRAASAYDTLLQMGRWFGYRNGYSDLVRIWMTTELGTWFHDLATVEAEIRREIGRYGAENLDPSRLAVKVRTHPAMTVTAAAKMRAAVQASLSYSGGREQTILFKHRDQDWLQNNWKAGVDLLDTAAELAGVEQATVDGTSRFALRSVPASAILDFLVTYQFHENANRLSGALIRSYVEQELAAGGLTSWSVVVMDQSDDKAGTASLGRAGAVNLIQRSRMIPLSDHTANIKALASKQDRGADLGKTFLDRLGKDPSDDAIRDAREKIDAGPVLALYPISKDSKPANNAGVNKKALEAVADVLGVCFFFPRAKGATSTVTYVAADLPAFEIEEPDVDEIDAADEAAAKATPDVQSGATVS